jgi:hypothetical protein
VEWSLHRQLKERFGPVFGGRLEVGLEGFRIDAIDADGALIEIQSGSLGPLRGKLRRLLPSYRVRVVKPVVLSRRLLRRAQSDGEDLSARLSPRRGELVEVFDDLVGLVPFFPHPNLDVEILTVEIDELRLLRRRRPGYTIFDRRLRAVVESMTLRQPPDLWALLPNDLINPFTTRDLADRLGRPLDFAQRVAYFLRSTGAAETVGNIGNRRVYAKRYATASSLKNNLDPDEIRIDRRTKEYE